MKMLKCELACQMEDPSFTWTNRVPLMYTYAFTCFPSPVTCGVIESVIQTRMLKRIFLTYHALLGLSNVPDM